MWNWPPRRPPVPPPVLQGSHLRGAFIADASCKRSRPSLSSPLRMSVRSNSQWKTKNAQLNLVSAETAHAFRTVAAAACFAARTAEEAPRYPCSSFRGTAASAQVSSLSQPASILWRVLCC